MPRHNYIKEKVEADGGAKDSLDEKYTVQLRIKPLPWD